jgi:hypothetical protein
MKMRTKTAAGVAAGLAAIGVGGAFAASGSSTATASSFVHDVAQRLGISDQKLTDALKGASIDRVDQALKDGRITQAQADALKERIQSGDGVPFFGGGGFGGPDGGLGHVRTLDGAAAYLGLTEAELRDKLRSGSTLAGLATAAGRSVDGLKTAIRDAAKADLDKAVAAGDLTNAQEQEFLSRLDDDLDSIVTGTLPERRDHAFAPGPNA